MNRLGVLSRRAVTAALVCWMLGVFPASAAPTALPPENSGPAPALGPVHTLLTRVEQALAAGQPERAAQLLQQAGEAASGPGYAAFRYSMLSARLALARQQPEAAVQHARRAVSLAVPEDMLEARLLLAEALEADSRPVEAAEALLAAAESSTVSYRGLLRDELISRLERLAGRIEGHTPDERAVLLNYGRLLNRYGEYRKAIALFSGREWEESQLEATAELARALAATGQNDLRLDMLESALRQAAAAAVPASRLSNLRLQLAEEYRRRQRTDEAVRLLEAVLGEDGRSEAAGQALQVLVGWELEPPDPGPANLEAAWRLIERHARSAGRTAGWREAVWNVFTRALVTPESLHLARRALDLLVAVSPGDPAVLYWAARLLELRDDPTGPAPGGPPPQLVERVTRLHRVAPLSYYALLARARWPKLAPPLPTGDGLAAAAEPLPEALVPIVKLYDGQHVEEAIGELRHWLKDHPSPAAELLLANWELKAGRYREALGRFGALLARKRDDGPASGKGADPGPGLGSAPDDAAPAMDAAGSLPRPLLEGLFPRPYRSRVEAAAARWGLDPYLLFAVTREESSFEADAYSHARAHGLMQLLLPTAAWIAGQLGLTPPTPSDLFEPEVNLELGAAYLRYLLNRYGDRRLAVAAYHAGPSRVDAWLREFGPRTPEGGAKPPGASAQDGPVQDVEWFVERIPIPATRRYVQNVERSWRVYRLLYGQG